MFNVVKSAVAVAAFAAASHAQVYLLHTQGSLGQDVSLSVPPPPATATSALISVRHLVRWDMGAENFSPSPGIFGPFGLRDGWTLSSGGNRLASQRVHIVRYVELAAFDGTIDFDGPSGEQSTAFGYTSETSTVPSADLATGSLVLRADFFGYAPDILYIATQHIATWQADIRIEYQ